MAGHMLDATASLKCPHGGKVKIVVVHRLARAGGALLATTKDKFTVIDCPFQIPAVVPIPSPCMTVRWLVPDLLVTAGKAATLSQSSLGICYSAQQAPQGLVIIKSTQSKVTSK